MRKYNGMHIGIHVFLYTEVQWIAHWHTCFYVYMFYVHINTIDCTCVYMFLTYRKAKRKAGQTRPATGCNPAEFRRQRQLCGSLKERRHDIQAF